MRKHSRALKREVTRRFLNGEKAEELAKEYGINPNSILYWARDDELIAGGEKLSYLEMEKRLRETEDELLLAQILNSRFLKRIQKLELLLSKFQ